MLNICTCVSKTKLSLSQIKSLYFTGQNRRQDKQNVLDFILNIYILYRQDDVLNSETRAFLEIFKSLTL